ncbi:MAG: hypothetical protein KAT17_04105 [Candidatus Aminicenantes bacterium]|nr:hypothetical protein [Candidatus Aminicenantes bacterium]
MKLKKVIFKNFGLKLTAIFIALFVWIQITGKERLYIEKTFDIDVEYINVSENIDVRIVRPEQIKLKVRGTSNEIKKISPEAFKVRVDLKGIREEMRLNLFTEDYLVTPEGTQVVSIHPKMIEMKIEEFMSKEVPVKVQFSNNFPRGVQFKEIRIQPSRVRIFGYRSQIQSVNKVSILESIDRSKIKETVTITVPIKKQVEIIKFEDAENVEITIVVEKK